MTLNQDLVAEITREVVARLQAQMKAAPSGAAQQRSSDSGRRISDSRRSREGGGDGAVEGRRS